MARVRLAVIQSLRVQPQEVIDQQGVRIVLPFLRVNGVLRVGRRAHSPCDCIIDIGAPLTVIPRLHWRRFASDIEWLTTVPGSAQSWVTNVYGRTGGNAPCRIGRVEVVAVDVFQPSLTLASVPVIALFEQQLPVDDRILIGLHASILQRRRLHVDPDAAEGWIEDR
jgi:hypothetical protein